MPINQGFFGIINFFISINNTKSIIDREISMQENVIFVERYMIMQNYLQNLCEAYKMDKMNKGNICLSIVRMLNHGDAEQLVDAVSELNRYYQKYIYEENR